MNKIITVIFAVSAFVSTSNRTGVTEQQVLHIKHVTEVVWFYFPAKKHAHNQFTADVSLVHMAT